MKNFHRFVPAALAFAGVAALLFSVARGQEEFGIDGEVRVKASGPVWESMPGESVYYENVPANIREREKAEKKSRASNEVVKIEGEFKFDVRVADMLGLSGERPPEVTCIFKRTDGKTWQFFPKQDAILERGRRDSPIYAFGSSNKGTPLEPRQKVALRLRGTGRLEKDRKTVAQDVPFNLVIGSRTRDPETGKYVGGYESANDGFEAKLVIPETFEIRDTGDRGLTIVWLGVTIAK